MSKPDVSPLNNVVSNIKTLVFGVWPVSTSGLYNLKGLSPKKPTAVLQK
jgi:hypothetical protein